VNTVSFDASGNLATLDATFVQYCNQPTNPPLTGRIIYGLAPPDPTGGPAITTATYSPKKGVIVVTGKHITHQCMLVVDGIVPYNVTTKEIEQAGTTITIKHDQLSPGVHQLQVANLAGQLSPEFPLTVR
jgi:hypothetical protein